MITYKELIFDEDAIMNLYLANKWYSYTNDKESLYKGIKQSIDKVGVYEDNLLVGFLRTIGDQETIIYVQDILVLPEYQRRGIGTKLLKDIISKYPKVRQIVLATDDTEKTRQFYESIGMVSYDKIGCIGFMVKK